MLTLGTGMYFLFSCVLLRVVLCIVIKSNAAPLLFKENMIHLEHL
jgi:hypothetical protein